MTTDPEFEPMPVAKLLSKEMFLTKRLTHGRVTSGVRLQVWDRFGRAEAALKHIVYNNILMNGEDE